MYGWMYVCNASFDCYPERSLSTMRRVKASLHSMMKTERLAALSLMHAYRDIPIDVEAVIREFWAKKNRRLAFESGVPPRYVTVCNCVARQVITLSLSLTTTTTSCIFHYFLVNINLSTQLHQITSLTSLEFSEFSGRACPRTPLAMSRLGLFFWVLTPQYAFSRLTNKKCHRTSLK